MKLWKISQEKNRGYETYDSAVVAADTEAEAKRMSPGKGDDITTHSTGSWVVDPAYVQCEYLGEAKTGTHKGVICASYNAG
ncbi:MAG: hypothetical protein M0R22_01005 [Dehalococcoidia bacterium]|jgi:hypothetical protein|nr:hypothetical protein [Dehalococcoidia bacterium]